MADIDSWPWETCSVHRGGVRKTDGSVGSSSSSVSMPTSGRAIGATTGRSRAIIRTTTTISSSSHSQSARLFSGMVTRIPLREVFFLVEADPTVGSTSSVVKKPGEQSNLSRVDADRANRLAGAAMATAEQFRKQLSDLQRLVGGKYPSLADSAARLLAAAKLLVPHEKQMQALLPAAAAVKTDEDGAVQSTAGMSPASSASGGSGGY